MSAAFSSSERSTLVQLGQVVDAIGSVTVRKSFEQIYTKLLALRHCDQCGVLFEGLWTADECHHCEEYRKHLEAREQF